MFVTHKAFFFPHNFGLFVNGCFDRVAHRNHAVELFMANVPNKHISHHRSHTQLNKDKLAFRHRHSHGLYLLKLSWNLAGGSRVLCSRGLTPPPPAESCSLVVKKRREGSNKNRARHTILSEPCPTLTSQHSSPTVQCLQKNNRQ